MKSDPTTIREHFGVINAENLKRAHQLIESGRSRGKVVLEVFKLVCIRCRGVLAGSDVREKRMAQFVSGNSLLR